MCEAADITGFHQEMARQFTLYPERKCLRIRSLEIGIDCVIKRAGKQAIRNPPIDVGGKRRRYGSRSYDTSSRKRPQRREARVILQSVGFRLAKSVRGVGRFLQNVAVLVLEVLQRGLNDRVVNDGCAETNHRLVIAD